ncbi:MULTISPECIES: anti-sigma factor [Reichenbachiella]|uniref:anti-sigma factor n=1 Tax=Reichenbachiella TaxID=156993 RepID=UPI000E6CB85F|nr:MULTISPECIES: anti-sigma factor [Reichenbachiella]MBU2913054.1 anti-sigma factor [Reichenbachiella agariperforans]RJE74939.1 hypothetical protein BGP76_17625 [Reichenbachiella sp. MSK19-1]
MNKQEILNEGYLVAYITGELTSEQTREIEEFISSDEEVKHEYEDLERILEMLSFDRAVTPAATVKKLIMEHRDVQKKSTDHSMLRYMVAASVFIAIVSAVASLYYRGEWQSAERELSDLNLQHQELAEGFQFVKNELASNQVQFDVVNSPDFRRIILDGTPNAASAKTVLFWNPEQEEIYLNSSTLAALPEGKQYQLWALKDGQPIDAGVFDADAASFQVMKNIAQADAFAVTVEQVGGAASPTLSTMQVYGEA